MHSGVRHALVLVALLAAPVSAQAATVQAESGRLSGPGVKLVREPAAHGGRAVALSGAGSLVRRFAARRISEVRLRGRGLPCRGRARLRVRMDGRRPVVLVLRSRRFSSMRIARRLGAGRHRAVVRLARPRRTPACSRRAVVDSLAVRALPAPARAPAPRIDSPTPAPAPAPADPPVPAGGYRNPVFASPGLGDPGVLDVGGAHGDYYAFGTGERFPAVRSADLVNWTVADPALAARPAWADQSGQWNPWAPSVIEREGACPGESGPRCFVLFHVAKHGTLTSPPTNCIGVAVSPVPGGPYRPLGPLAFTAGGVDSSGRPPGCGDDAGYSNIDPAPFVDGDGDAFLYLSTGHRCATPAPNAECPWDRAISVIPLAAGLLTASGPRQELFRATDPGWETGSFGPVVENPWMVRNGATYLLMYSGGAFNGAYGMGFASAGSPIGPFDKSAANPILREAEGVLSPGGGMAVLGPKGATWLAYHGRRGSYANPRELRVDRLRFPTASSIAIDGPTAAAQPAAP